MTNLDKLIQDHWTYTERTLIAHDVSEKEVAIAKHYYYEVWRHAVKHERERVAEVKRMMREAVEERPDMEEL